MYELTVASDFSAAHRLRGYQGACENLHGHNWRVELVVAGENPDRLGMLMDFKELRRILHDVTSRFDHVFLNGLAEFKRQNPTTENMARIVFEECAKKMPRGVSVRAVSVWESPQCGARYTATSRPATKTQRHQELRKLTPET